MFQIDWFGLMTALIGLMFAGAALFASIGYYRQGKSQQKLDEGNNKLNTNELLKDQIDALEHKVNTQATDIENLTKEVHDLHTAIDERDKKFAATILQLTGKDPQMTAFIEIVKQYIAVNTPLLETIKDETIPTIRDLKKYLDKQTY